MFDVIDLSTKAQFDEAIASGRVVIDFARRTGCVPCQRLEPHYKAAASATALEGITFYKVMLDEADSDLLGHAMDVLNVRGTPTVIEFLDGERQRDISGRTAPLIIKELST